MSNRIIVTGAAGFIGSNLVRALNARGYKDVIAVDHLKRGEKFQNLLSLDLADFIDKKDFYTRFRTGEFDDVEAIFHQGACSDTMEHDGSYMMANNYETSRLLLERCGMKGTRLIYASSAATYGASKKFVEDPAFEKPLNVYGYSKLLFDRIVRKSLPDRRAQLVGLRYFNVYGPHEQHKSRMASVAYHNYQQFISEKRVKIFGAYGDCAAGEQKRDFLFVEDAVAVNLWFFDHPEKSGVFNLGSGEARPFNDVAAAVVNGMLQINGEESMPLEALVRSGLIEYIPFPESLKGKYQCFTRADLTALRQIGCDHVFTSVTEGVRRYVQHLHDAQNTL